MMKAIQSSAESKTGWWQQSSLVIAWLMGCVVCHANAWADAAKGGEANGGVAAHSSDETSVDAPILTVAVLGFESGSTLDPQAGQMLTQVLEMLLVNEPSIQLVDRLAIDQILEEQALNQTGLVGTQQALKVGQIVGARILVLAKAMEFGESRIFSAKLIGTETTLVDGVLVRGGLATPADQMLLELGEKLLAKTVEAGPRLARVKVPKDPVPALISKLKDRSLPTVAVLIREEHLPDRIAQLVAPPDPAVETEIKKMLLEAGFSIQDVPQNQLAEWIIAAQEGQPIAWPKGLGAVDYVVFGEGLSDAAGVIGRLRGASARVEINMVERSTGKIVVADRVTTKALDLSETIAAKSALQKAGHRMGQALLRWAAGDLN